MLGGGGVWVRGRVRFVCGLFSCVGLGACGVLVFVGLLWMLGSVEIVGGCVGGAVVVSGLVFDVCFWCLLFVFGVCVGALCLAVNEGCWMVCVEGVCSGSLRLFSGCCVCYCFYQGKGKRGGGVRR